MKRIFLIEQSPDVFNTIKNYLRENDIPFSEFKSVEEMLKSPDIPGLVIYFGPSNIRDAKKELDMLKANPSYARVSRILICPFNSLYSDEDIKALDVQANFVIPVDKLQFITSVSRLLRRAPRRVFRIVISIQAEKSNIRYSGLSIDFSETGMAFECDADFDTGSRIKVQFVNPRSRKRFFLTAEIIRKASTQLGGPSFYGAMFKDLTAQDTSDLIDFITGEK